MKVDDAETAVRRAWEEIPEQVREALADVEIYVAEKPADVETEEGEEPLPDDCQGVFCGVIDDGDEAEDEAEDEEGDDVDAEPPEGDILLFACNLDSPEECRRVLYHEIGHALGMDEAEVSALGMG